jgi:hypothetical protein
MTLQSGGQEVRVLNGADHQLRRARDPCEQVAEDF